MSSPKRPKATPVSSRTSGMGNSKVERALALERVYRQIDKAELNYVTSFMNAWPTVVGNRRIGDRRELATEEKRWHQRIVDRRERVAGEKR